MRGIGTGALGRGAAWLGLGVVVAVGLLAAEPARAGDDFERGFKSELGRIAAHEAVSAGLHILGGILHPVYASHGYGHRGYGHRGYGRHDRGLHRGHYKHRKPCGYGDYERYERHDGYGGYEHYERHSRYPYRGRIGYYDD